jgi:signal transduction histidine kinase
MTAIRKPLSFLPGRLQGKNALVYFGVIALALAMLNFYPLIVSRDFIYQTKQQSLLRQAQDMAFYLSDLSEVQPEAVASAMTARGWEPVRVVVTDAEARVVFDNSTLDPLTGRWFIHSELLRALMGFGVFHIQYTGGAFESVAAVPLVSEGRIVGAVWIHESDTEQAGILVRTHRTLLNMTAITATLAVVLTFGLSAALSRRMRRLLAAVHDLRAGRYGRRIDLRGRDELTVLAGEFDRLAERIEHTETVRRQFVSDASHELRTPLSSMRLLTDSILQTPDIDTGTVREFVGDIAAELDRLAHMTERLMQLSKAEAYRPNPANLTAPPQTESDPIADCAAVLFRVQKSLTPLAERDHIKLRVEAESGCRIRADEIDLYQLAYNLIENAIKYNVPGGEVRVKLFTRGIREISGSLVILTVTDTGIGIPEADIPYIYDRFYRVDKARTRIVAEEDTDETVPHGQEVGGAGLGLAIVYHTVWRLGGSITVESEVGKGTRFVVQWEAV